MAKKRTVTFPKRGEIYIVHFDPTLGSEIGKTRPALVVQNEIGNQYSPATIVTAITSKFDPARLYPTEVLVEAPEGGLTTDSVVLLNQVRTIDKQRLGRRLGTVNSETMERIDRAIFLSFGLI